MDLKKIKQTSDVIKSLEDKIEKYKIEKDFNSLVYALQLKNVLLDTITNSKEVYIAETSSNNQEKEEFRYRLVVEVLIFDDNAEPVYIEIDLETGEISLLDEGKHYTNSRIISKKGIKADFEIKTLMPIMEATKIMNSEYGYCEENRDFRVLDYIKNNPEKFNNANRNR